MILVVLDATSRDLEVVFFAGVDDDEFTFGVGDDDSDCGSLFVGAAAALANDFRWNHFAEILSKR